MSRAIESARALWKELQERAGLDVSRYDKEIFLELSAAVGLPNVSPRAFSKALATSGVTIETLVDALLGIARPYTGMTKDILRMFEDANATHSQENLRVRFDFDASKAQLDIDLSHFREYDSYWTVVTRTAAVREWDGGAMWELNRALGNMSVFHSDRVSLPQDWRRWIQEYLVGHSFPSWIPEPPRLAGDAANVARVAWNVFQSFFESVRSNARSQEHLYSVANGAAEQQRHEDRRDGEVPWKRELSDEQVRDETPHSEGPSGKGAGRQPPSESPTADELHKLAIIESDFWCGSLLTALAEFVSRAGDATFVASVWQKVQQIRTRLPVTLQSVKERIEELFEILSLPVWKRRHELYAVWVGSAIVRALGPNNVRVHSYKGEINFRFSGTHLATVSEGARDPLYVWAELRSPYANPVGKGRKAAIQPDYTVTHAPVTDPRSSVLIVECKQYQKASRKNFVDALVDYTSGRPNAHVLLVNYGPVGGTLTSQLPPKAAARASALGKFRPGEEESLKLFQQEVQRAIGAASRVSSVELSWQRQPSDLDLHVVAIGNPEVWEVNYGQRGSLAGPPWAELSDDVRSGFGPETVRFAPDFQESFQCLVHNYSHEISLSGSGARVVIRTNNKTLTVDVPSAGTGDWWHVFDCDGQQGALRVVNEILSRPEGTRRRSIP